MIPMVRTLAFLGLSSLLWGVSTPQLTAQTAPAPRSTPVNKALTPKPDMSVLAQALTNFFTGKATQTESNMAIDATSKTMNVRVQYQTTTIVQAPGRFRAEISLNPMTKQAQPSDKILVISDGQRVWMYRPDLKQYSSMTYQEFNRRNDSWIIGMTSMLYLQLAPDIKPYVDQGSLTDKTVQEQLSAMATSDLKGGSQQVNGENLFVYEYVDKKAQISYSALIRPLDKSFKQVQFKGNMDGGKIAMTETIQKRIANPTIAPDTFRFKPPQGTKQVKSLQLIPF
jgi:outer membrane lipoprotein-sorting protein